MKDHPRILAARARAEAARARLRGTVFEAKARLSPGAMADRAVESVKDRALTVVADGVASARKRPVVIGAVVGAVALLFSQRPIRRLLGQTMQRQTMQRQTMQPDADVTVSSATPRSRSRNTL